MISDSNENGALAHEAEQPNPKRNSGKKAKPPKPASKPKRERVNKKGEVIALMTR